MSKSIVRPDTSRTSLIILEEHTDALTVVNTANGLGEDVANLQDLQLGALLEVLFLGHGVGCDDLVNRTGVDTLHSISREHTVGDECVDLLSALLLEELGSTVMVLEVSARSSTRIAVRPRTSPTSSMLAF